MRIGQFISSFDCNFVAQTYDGTTGQWFSVGQATIYLIIN